MESQGRLLAKVQNEDSESLNQDTESKNSISKMRTGKIGIGRHWEDTVLNFTVLSRVG